MKSEAFERIKKRIPKETKEKVRRVSKMLENKEKMIFYEFTQYDQGDNWCFEGELAHRLYIEAVSKEEAYRKAESLGVYFDGVSKGIDSEKYGDRWLGESEEELKQGWLGELKQGWLSETQATRIAEIYGGSVYSEESLRSLPDCSHGVVFPNIEAYAQYMVDLYGFGKPAARIFYHDGRRAEIFSNNTLS
jgi:hypothetical protein